MRFFTARSLALATLVPALFLFVVVPGCAKQSEGERCGNSLGAGASDDCGDGLTCTKFGPDGDNRCCYPDGHVSDSRCELNSGVTATASGGSGSGGSGASEADASDASAGEGS